MRLPMRLPIDPAMPSLPRACRTLGIVALVLLLAACAHPISVTPDVRLLADLPEPRLPLSLALHVAPEDTEREVTTPGGGGDSVRYFLYRDLESPLVLALSRVFEKVVVVRRPPTGEDFAREGFQLAVQPRLTSASGSTSGFTWPPTFFNLSLTAAFRDATGKTVASIDESGTGRAQFSEFRTAHGLAGQRAAADLMNRFMQRVRRDPALATLAPPRTGDAGR